MGHLAMLLLSNAAKKLTRRYDLFAKHKFKRARGDDHRVLKSGMKIVMVYFRHDANSAGLNLNYRSTHNTENAL
jgi:hypothetical protein